MFIGGMVASITVGHNVLDFMSLSSGVIKMQLGFSVLKTAHQLSAHNFKRTVSGF